MAQPEIDKKPEPHINLKYFKWGAAGSMTIAIYFIFKITLMTIYHPEATVPDRWYNYFYLFTGLIIVYAIPLWYYKIRSIRDFEAELTKIYGDNEQMKNHAILESLKPHIKQAVIAFLLALAIYYALSMYVITPEVKLHYVNYVLMQNGRMPIGFNYSNLTFYSNFTFINDSLGGK